MNNTHEKSQEFLNKWRSGVPKALVLVTDDDSKISAPLFMNQIPQSVKGEVVGVHSIVALSKQESPCLASVGEEYIKLSQMTNGKIFNICQEDWDSIFDQLAKDIESQLSTIENTIFTVSQEKIKEIQSLTINGLEIDSQNFTINENKIIISESIFSEFQENVFEIRIKYFY